MSFRVLFRADRLLCGAAVRRLVCSPRMIRFAAVPAAGLAAAALVSPAKVNCMPGGESGGSGAGSSWVDEPKAAASAAFEDAKAAAGQDPADDEGAKSAMEAVFKSTVFPILTRLGFGGVCGVCFAYYAKEQGIKLMYYAGALTHATCSSWFLL